MSIPQVPGMPQGGPSLGGAGGGQAGAIAQAAVGKAIGVALGQPIPSPDKVKRECGLLPRKEYFINAEGKKDVTNQEVLRQLFATCGTLLDVGGHAMIPGGALLMTCPPLGGAVMGAGGGLMIGSWLTRAGALGFRAWDEAKHHDLYAEAGDRRISTGEIFKQGLKEEIKQEFATGMKYNPVALPLSWMGTTIGAIKTMNEEVKPIPGLTWEKVLTRSLGLELDSEHHLALQEISDEAEKLRQQQQSEG